MDSHQILMNGLVTGTVKTDAIKKGRCIRQINSDNRYCYDVVKDDTFHNIVNECRRLIGEYYEPLDPDSEVVSFITINRRDSPELTRHTDESKFTVNICLDSAEDGGSLCFEGVQFFSDPDIVHVQKKLMKKLSYSDNRYHMKSGKFIIHRGKHEHFMTKVKNSDTRHHLILWFM